MLPMLVDSNIIIYAAKPEHPDLRDFIAQYAPAVSAVSYVEVLGYHKLTEQDRFFFEAFFRATKILSISQTIVEQAIPVTPDEEDVLRRCPHCRNSADTQSDASNSQRGRLRMDRRSRDIESI